jgi:hypothetical protein
MSGELTYDLFDERSHGFRAAGFVCAIAVVLLALWMVVPVVLRYHASPSPAKQKVALSPQPRSTTATSDVATTNIRVISIDRPATGGGPMLERADSETAKQTVVATPETFPSVEVTARPPQASVEANSAWPSSKSTAQPAMLDADVMPILLPPFPHPRPRVEAIIAASRVPLPRSRPQINSDEPMVEPDVRSDRLSVLN